MTVQRQMQPQQQTNSNNKVVTSSFKEIARGSLTSFLGILSAVFLIFLARVIVTRFYSQSEYGVFSVTLIVLNICAVISGLGLCNGISRNIAFYKAKGFFKKADQVIVASLKISLFMGICFLLVLFFLAESMATTVLKDPRLTEPLHIIAFCIPLLVLTNILVAVFRGVGNINARAYFVNIIPNIFFVIILLAIVLLRKPFRSIFYGYWLSFFATFSLLLVYTAKKLRLTVPPGILIRHTNVRIMRELLSFSFPLLVISAAQMVMLWTDSLMLQYYKGSEVVGLYNVATPLARFLYLPMSATLLIYLPVTSRLYAQQELGQLKRNYLMVVKWVFVGAFPAFVVLFFSPAVILTGLFTSQYVNASQPLRILLIGFLAVNLLGPNAATLLAMGETRFLMKISVLALFCNIVLNALLIPQWGVSGAATATTAGLILQSIIRHIRISSRLDSSLVSKNVIKTVVFSILSLLIALYLCRPLIYDSIGLLFVFAVFSYIILLAIMYLSGSFEDAEKEVAFSIARKLRGKISMKSKQ